MLEAFVALTSIACGVGLTVGAVQFPLAWLQGTPFSDYTIPGLVMAIIVGGGVLTPDANTLVILHTKDFREGYERGRRDYFTQYEEIAHTENDLLDLLKARAQDNLYLGREQSTLRWTIGCTVEELVFAALPAHQTGTTPPASCTAGQARYRFARGVKEGS